jgi:hypothetical protein
MSSCNRCRWRRRTRRAVGRCWSESISRRRRRSVEVTARADAGAGEGVDTGIGAKAGAGERAFVEGEVTWVGAGTNKGEEIRARKGIRAAVGAGVKESQ